MTKMPLLLYGGDAFFFLIVKYVYFIQNKKGRREGFMDAWHRGGTEGIFVG